MIVVLIVMVISYLLTQHFTVSYGDRLVTEQLSRWGKNFEAMIQPDFVYFNYPQLDSHARDVLKDRPGDFLILYHANGKEILRRGVRISSVPLSLGKRFHIRKADTPLGEYYILSIPVKALNSDAIWGHILYGHSLRQQNSFVASLRNSVLYTGLALFIVAVLLLRLIIRRMMAPVNDLTVGLETISRGDMSSRLSVSSNDEFGFLADKYNEMAGQLESTMAEVESTQRDLETQISQRTLALNTANEKLKEAMEELKYTQKTIIQTETQKSLTSIVSGFAHEINNPLTGILGYIDLMELDTHQPPHTQKRLEGIKDQGLRIKAVIDELNQLDPEIEKTKMEIDLGNLLEKLLKIISKKNENEGITFEKDFFDKSVVVVGNHFALWQVFEGVVENALEAIKERGVSNGKIKVSLKKSPVQPVAVAEVRDNGGGVEFLDKVFNPFFTTKNRTKKRGIGLSIAFNVVSEHGGNIEIKNREGGAVVSISLPYYAKKTGREAQV